MGYNRIKNINIKKYKELVFPYFLQVKHVHSLLGSLSYTDSQTIDALIKKILHLDLFHSGSMNTVFLNSNSALPSLLLPSRLVTRAYFWKWRLFMGLKTSEVEELQTSHSA